MRRLLAIAGLLAMGLLDSRLPAVQINELQSANDTTLLDEDGDSSDWIELWNPASTTVDLSGYGLSDRFNNPFKWFFQPGATIGPGEFLIIHASGKDRQPTPALPVSPDALPGLEIWLRADSVDPSDPGQVRSSGSLKFLRAWRDRSGWANHASQGNDSFQPQWVPAGSNSFASVRFDGADDLLLLGQPAATNSFCIVFVCRTSAAHETDTESMASVGGTSGQHYLLGARHGGDLDAGMGLSIGTNGISVYEHGTGYMPALALYQRYLGKGLLVIAVNYAAKQTSIDWQGLPVHMGLTSPRREVWAPVEIGAGAYGAFGGDLLELAVYRRALSVEERRGVAREMAARYAIPLPLPRHTSFQLSAEGEELVLTRPDGTRADSVSFGVVPRDVSYGRAPAAGGAWQFFGVPTPGAANSTAGTTEWLFAPEFSHPGGFYTNAFDLGFTNANSGAEIRYTLNGAEPSTNSPLFASPIQIRSRAGTGNFLSAIPTSPGWQPPAGEVFKGWVVRARAFKPGAMPSPVVTRTFWVHPLGRQRYSVPVLSLTTERANFFDPDIGIYVPGNAPNGNYAQRGPEWERPVHVEFYETNNALAFAQYGDVKIHGNTSHQFPIKGLDLDATGGAGGQPFRHQIFPDRSRKEFEHFLLRPSGHDSYMAIMRDELLQALAAQNGAESQAAHPCIVFLNGEYWGLHYLKEKEDAAFVAFYAERAEDEIDYLEGYATAKAGDTRHYDALIQFMATNDPADPPVYEQAQAWMEVPNYIDYKVHEIFDYRWDIGNHRLWRPRTPEGRWRWLQFDNDVGWGGLAATQPAWAYDMLAADLSPDGRLHDGHNNETTTFLLRRLVLNPTFRTDFINRFADLLNTTFLPTNTLAEVDRHATRLAPEMAEHTQRWRAPASYPEWQQAVDYLREFARLRPDACRQHLMTNFRLPGTARLDIGISPPDGGVVRLNSLTLSPTNGVPWQGVYFKGNPVHLVALPAEGFRFANWSRLAVATNDVRLLLQGDWEVTAQFAPIAVAPAKLSLRPSSANAVELQLQGQAGTHWEIETSADLIRWTSLSPVILNTQGQASVILPITTTQPARFLRARAL